MSKENIKLAVANATPEPWLEAKTPNGYRLDQHGVYRTPEDGEPIMISGPVWVRALTRDLQNMGWGAVVRWIDRDNKPHERAIPFPRFHEQGPALAQELAAEGLLIVPGKERQLSAYLCSFNAQERIQSIPRLGWLDDPSGQVTYVLPNEVITKGTSEQCIFQPERYSPTASTIRESGTLEEWKEHVAEPCRGNPYFVFGLVAGLSGLLLKFAGLDSGGFHFYGASSRGKTTLAQAVASLFGCGTDPAEAAEMAFIRRWNTTVNALEGLAASHNDNVLVLDELGTCSAHDFGKAIYDLAGGQGKAAMDVNRSLKAQRIWRIQIISTGELSVQQKIEESGKTVKAGQLLRLMDIPIHGGIVRDSHAMEQSKFINVLKRNCSLYFGVAGPAFLRSLIYEAEDAQEFRMIIQQLLDTKADELTPEKASPEQQRAIRRFALVLVAGILAVRFDILPFSEPDIAKAVRIVLGIWLDANRSLPDAQRGVEAIKEFILKHGARFRNVNDTASIPRDLSGYVDTERGLYLFTKAGFKEACGGSNPADVARELSRNGFLFKNDSDRHISKHAIKGVSQRLSLYAVKPNILEDGVS